LWKIILDNLAHLKGEDDGKESLEGDGQGGEDGPDPEDVNESVANRKYWRENNILEKIDLISFIINRSQCFGKKLRKTKSILHFLSVLYSHFRS
jgi:hypothetical protein